MPMVSVITPTYNRAHMLKDAIESVLAQTLTDWEHVIVDDGSTDGTAALVQDYVQRDSRIHYLYRTNGGLPAARNAGLAEARSAYVAFLDDDDLFLPDKLKQQVAVMARRPDLGLLYAPVREVHDNRDTAKSLPPRLIRTFEELFHGNTPQVSSVLVRRACLDQVGGFDETLRHCQDYDLWLRLAARFPFDYLSEPVAVYRRHRTNMSRKLTGILSAQLGIFQRMRDLQAVGVSAEAHRCRLATLAYELARAEVDAGQYGQAATHFVQAARWRPDIGVLVRDYQDEASQGTLRKFVKPYLGAGYYFCRGLLHASR